jgi:hypothetical protein
MYPVNDLLPQVPGVTGLDAFATLLRSRIPGYPERGSLQAFADRVNGQITSSEMGRYARGEIRPNSFQRLELLARAMNLPVDYCRAVLEGRDAGPVPLPTDDVARLIEIQEQAAGMLEEAQRIARRLTIQHAQSTRQGAATRKPKRGLLNGAWMNRREDVRFQPA